MDDIESMTRDELHRYKREVFLWKKKEMRWMGVDRINKRLMELQESAQDG